MRPSASTTPTTRFAWTAAPRHPCRLLPACSRRVPLATTPIGPRSRPWAQPTLCSSREKPSGLRWRQRSKGSSQLLVLSSQQNQKLHPQATRRKFVFLVLIRKVLRGVSAVQQFAEKLDCFDAVVPSAAEAALILR